jgi:hypothetical protein
MGCFPHWGEDEWRRTAPLARYFAEPPPVFGKKKER